MGILITLAMACLGFMVAGPVGVLIMLFLMIIMRWLVRR